MTNNVHLQQDDITTAQVDAIINAANPQLLGGGGVDGAIHRAAGPALLEACLQIDEVDGVRCPIGEARITPAGDLLARFVIHTVGPRYGIDENPSQRLEAAYRHSYELALANGCKTLAVPAVSCGVYGYPLQEAATIAIDTSCQPAFADLDITFYLFGDDIFQIFSSALAARPY
ncbi:MAG: macro domain-containing protein [Pseudomonadota bacterium]